MTDIKPMFVLEFVAAVAGSSSSNHYTHTHLRRTHLLLPVHLSALRLKRASRRRRRGQLAQLTINAAVTQVGRSRPLSLSLYVSLPACLSVCASVCVCFLHHSVLGIFSETSLLPLLIAHTQRCRALAPSTGCQRNQMQRQQQQ